MDGLLFGSGGISVAVAIILAKLIWNRWFSGDDKHERTTSRNKAATAADLVSLRDLLELRFSQQHDDLKAIKAALYEARDTCRWLREAHDQRDNDGSFRWWNKQTVEGLIRTNNNLLRALETKLDERQNDAAQAKQDLLSAIHARRRNNGG